MKESTLMCTSEGFFEIKEMKKQPYYSKNLDARFETLNKVYLKNQKIEKSKVDISNNNNSNIKD